VPALASFHLMSIREVFPGSTANPGEDYVELQMYHDGQNLVRNHALTVFAADGSVAASTFFAHNVHNGANQATILIGAANSVLGVTPDLVDADLTAIDPQGGAACFAGAIDCVSWGTFSGSVPAGSPAPAIPDGDALRRTIEPHCSTLLEPGDDTDDSATDFAAAAPNPRSNPMTPTEQPCPDTIITHGPSGRTHDRTPTFRFVSNPVGAPDFECQIDDHAFRTCDSPFTLRRLSLGGHTFRVRALNAVGGPDPSPAKQRFRVVNG
jgi:hypothetical protein